VVFPSDMVDGGEHVTSFMHIVAMVEAMIVTEK
jgi:hypothetical protein